MKWMDVALILVPSTVCVCLILHNLCILHGDNFDVEWISVIEHGAHDTLNASILQQQTPKRKAITQDFLEKLQGIHWTTNESLNCVKLNKLCIPSFNEKWWQNYKGGCNLKRCHGEIMVWGS